MKLEVGNEPINIMYYGDGGTGKTTNLAAMANSGRVLVINAEGGLKARPLQLMGINIENIEVKPEVGGVVNYDLLEKCHRQILSDLKDDPDSWAGVVWDSVTEIHQAMLLEVREDEIVKAERRGKEVDPFFNDLSYYGTMTEKMRTLIRRYRDLPCHFGISALERRDQDDDGKVKYGPAATPALANDLFGYVDIVVRTQVAEVAGDEEYQGIPRPHGKYRGKDRLKALPRTMIDPTFDRVAAYVNGHLTADTDDVMIEAKERRTRARNEEEESE